MIPLSTFIPVLEDMGLITDIDQRVMETAFSDFATWLEIRNQGAANRGLAAVFIP